MPKPILLIVESGQYKEAEFKFNKEEIEKSLVPKEAGQSFNLKELLPVGIQEKFKKSQVSGGLENVKTSIDSLLDDAKERVSDMGAPFFVAGIEINEYSDVPKDHMQIVIGHSYSIYHDIELRLQAYIKRE